MIYLMEISNFLIHHLNFLPQNLIFLQQFVKFQKISSLLVWKVNYKVQKIKTLYKIM